MRNELNFTKIHLKKVLTQDGKMCYNIYIERQSIIHSIDCRVEHMEKIKLTDNMVAVLTVLAGREEGKGFARQVLAEMEGKTFNGVNATLAAAEKKGLCTKAKAMFEDKLLTCYTITDAGREAIAPAEEVAVEDAE